MRQFICLLVIALPIFAGCGSGGDPAPPLFPVTGSLIVGGKPLENITVQLIPMIAEGSKAKPGIAKTDAEGKFEIRTNGDKGANAGKFKVVLGAAIAPSGPVSVEEATKMSGMYAKTKGIPKAVLPYPTEWSSEKTSPKEIEVTDQPVTIGIDI